MKNSFSLFIFLIVIISGIVYFPGGFQNNPNNWIIVLLLVIISIVWVSFFGVNLFNINIEDVTPSLNKNLENKSDLFKRIAIMVFGFIFSSCLIYCYLYC